MEQNLESQPIKEATHETSIKIFEELTDSFVTEWTKLWESSALANNCNRPEWLLSYQEAFGNKPLRIIAYYKDNILAGILALEQSSLYGISIFATPGGSHITKSIVLSRESDAETIAELLQAATKLGRIQLLEISEAAHQQIISDSGWQQRAVSGSWIAELSAEEAHFMRKDHFSRLKNIMNREGTNLRFELYQENCADFFKTMVAIEQASFKPLDGHDIFHETRVQKLYHAFMQRMPQFCVLVILWHKDTPIAHSFGMKYKDTFQGMHTAYNKEFRNLMPGKLSMLYLFQELKRLGIKKIDMGRGDQPNKRQFANERIIQYNALYVTNPLIRIYLKLLIWLRKDVWDKLPEYSKKIPRRLIRFATNKKTAPIAS